MDEQQLAWLRSQDWEFIAAQLLRAAPVFGLRYGWGLDSVLPDGNSLEDLVIQVIAEMWEEPGRRNPDISLVVQLNGIVRQKLYNLAKSCDDDVIRGAKLEQHPDGEDVLGKVAVDFAEAINRLLEHPKVKGREDFELVVIALSDGASSAAEIAKETNLETSRIYQIRRELREIYPDIARQLQRGRAI